MPDTVFSDHALVLLQTFSQSNMISNIYLRIPERVMLDDCSYNQVRDIWQRKGNMDASISNKVAHALLELSEHFKLRAKAEYMENREKEIRMRATLSSLQRLQQARPECTWVAMKLADAHKKVQQMEDNRSQFHYHNAASRWTQFGDRCTGQFFSCKGPRRQFNTICCMRNENGELEADLNAPQNFTLISCQKSLSQWKFNNKE